MRIHVLQHVPFEPPGSIEAWAKRTGHALAVTHPYRGDPLSMVEDADLLVVLGGPMSVHDEARYPWLVDEKRFIERTIAAGARVLGICLGAQLIAQVLGARVYAQYLPVDLAASTLEKIAWTHNLYDPDLAR